MKRLLMVLASFMSLNTYANETCSALFENGPRTGEEIDISCFDAEYETVPVCWKSGESVSSEDGRTVKKEFFRLKKFSKRPFGLQDGFFILNTVDQEKAFKDENCQLEYSLDELLAEDPRRIWPRGPVKYDLSKMKQFSLNNLNYSHSELEPYELVLYRDENADVTLSFFHLIDGLVEKTVFKAKK